MFAKWLGYSNITVVKLNNLQN